MSVVGWLAIGSSFMRRKSPIGGYLLYFLWCGFVGLGFSIYECVRDWEVYATGRVQAQFQVPYVLCYAPRILALVVVVAASALLVRTFAWRWVPLLRGALVATSICSGAGALLSMHYFSGRLPINLVTIYAPLIALYYSYASERFRRVFQTHDWQYLA